VRLPSSQTGEAGKRQPVCALKRRVPVKVRRVKRFRCVIVREILTPHRQAVLAVLQPCWRQVARLRHVRHSTNCQPLPPARPWLYTLAFHTTMACCSLVH